MGQQTARLEQIVVPPATSESRSVADSLCDAKIFAWKSDYAAGGEVQPLAEAIRRLGGLAPSLVGESTSDFHRRTPWRDMRRQTDSESGPVPH